MRRRRPTIAITIVLAGIALLLVGLGAPASAAPAGGHRVDIVKVTGLIDPINVDLVSNSIAAAERQHALLLVLQLSSTGATVSQATIDRLAQKVMTSPVPVAAWVGGSAHARAYGKAFTLLRSAAFAGEAPGSRVGDGPPPPGAAPSGLEHSTLSGDDAVDRHVLDTAEPTLVDFLGAVSGKTFKGVTVDLGVTGVPGTPGVGFRKDLTFDFSQLSIVPKLMHSAASPDVAFAMLVIALSLFVFEFFTAGVGVAAGTGVIFGVLSAYGLGVLPSHPWAVALIALAILGFAIDVQAGAPRFWTVAGGVGYVVGAVWLYHGQAVSWWVVIVLGVLLALFMISGMPAMVRTRFSTPTIGRESMIGEMGVALSGVDPEGTVQVRGAPWRARTNRATPIKTGEPVRVIALDGLLLEVEPETGGARDAHH
jgi:membrane-bound serine protease (ClpP class)